MNNDTYGGSNDHLMLSGLELIRSYRADPDRYLPMTDHTEEVPGRNEYGEVNIGWYAGLLEEKRPFFAECWAADQITWLTIYVSAKGIEGKTPAEMDRWFQDIGYYSYREDEHYPAYVRTFEKPNGDEFFMITVGVGVDDEPALIDGAPIIPWSVLNEYNRQTPG